MIAYLKTLAVTAFALLLMLSAPAQTTLTPAIEAKVNALLKQMTLEEKVGQMAQVSIESLGTSKGQAFSFSDKMKDAVVNYKIGSVLNTPGPLQTAQDWNRIIGELQAAAQTNRLKIPILYGLDDIHGVNYVAGTTLFPQQIAQAAARNRALVHQAGVITAYESRAAAVPWTFSPALDLGTNALWPRIWEDYGEDPYLGEQLGLQFIDGVQNPVGSKEKLAVSLKHYMAYSDPKSGKDRSDAWIPEHYLREYHLQAFAAAIKAGARNVMVNSALINGVPTHVNKHLLTDILKTELQFKGFIVTDWQDIENVYRRDRLTKDIKGAIMLAINAGIDMAMIPYDYKGFCSDLIALVKEGQVAQSRIDDAVRRILRVKYELGIFETPVTLLKDYPKFSSPEFEKAAYNTAAEAITLLKNVNNTLPIRKDAKLLVAGPNANSMRTLNGGWTYTWQGERTDVYAEKYNTIVEAVRNEFGAANVTLEQGVVYKPGGTFNQDTAVNMAAAVQAAANVDYIILCIGENSYTETPGNLNDLNLSDNQLALAQAMYQTGKPVVLVLNEGRPRIINRIEPGAAAIVDIYLPGNFGADALADVLSGDVNPSGKLPITYPRYANDLYSYIHKPSQGATNPQGGESNPQYEFGYGLSYTRFSYSDLKLNKSSYGPDETITVSVTVTNTGAREGKEAVQVFTSDLIASLTPDVKRLRAFDKISLKPGESKTVSLQIPVRNLAFVHTDNKKHLEAGDFTVQVEQLTAKFTVTGSVVF
ncbi:MAG TPA: glycoside hydrolase family 3 N-terminal domain-containing protein [Flavisolibacter sp.]|jgi:beta-glucosidase|nr:glycoside hydrolase family 3 N-terminal domain-containing protein [Flavisolibacter sp.]